MKTKYVLCTLYRFGYDLTVLTKTKREGKDLLMAEYLKTYLEWNSGEKPTVEEVRNAKRDIEYIPYVVNQVNWY